MTFADEFVEGFISYTDEHIPAYNHHADCETPCPWCNPWTFANPICYLRPNLTAYDMGREWADANIDDITDAFTGAND